MSELVVSSIGTASIPPGAYYCTVEQAEDAGATGTEAEIDAAIVAAMERVDAYTGQWFNTRTAQTVVATLGGDGLLHMPRRLQSVTSVTPIDGTAIASSSYRVRLSSSLGDVDAIELTWGWLSAGTRVTVVGTFGYSATPSAVRRATALLAAYLTTNPGGSSSTGVAGARSLSVEGYSVTFGSSGPELTTTGLLEADQLLQPYRTVGLA